MTAFVNRDLALVLGTLMLAVGLYLPLAFAVAGGATGGCVP